MKSLLFLSFSIIFGVVLNFSIFMIAYNKLIFPLIHEDQRMDIAPYLFTHVLPSFLVSTSILVLLTYIIGKKLQVSTLAEKEP